MKAAVLEAYHRPLTIKGVDLEPPGPGEVTLEVKACGLCMTDIHIAEGTIPTVKLPLIPGHEFAGRVVATGQGVTDIAVGDRVAVSVDIACGRCDFCLRAETTRCANLRRMGFERPGGMGERVNVPAGNVEKLADRVSFEKAAIIADAVASMYRGLRTAGRVGAGTRVAIMGTGGLGMQGVKIARMLGAEVACTDLVDAKLERARSLGAHVTVNPAKEDWVAAVRKQLGPLDVVIDTIGKGASLVEAVSALRNGGRVVALGYVDPRLQIPSYEITIKEKQIVGSRAASRAEFREVVRLINTGRLDPDIGELIPARRINEALEDLKHGRFLTRSVLVMPYDA
jgi:propanol-preferring alcohol dehydrogenase